MIKRQILLLYRIWYSLLIEVVPSDFIKNVQIECEVQKSVTTEVKIENPTNEKLDLSVSLI